MRLVECTACGSKELVEEDGLIVCVYCQARYVPQVDVSPPRTSIVGVASDIEALLKKCRDDPANRWRYASLVLDLDPTNREAQQYLS